MNKWKRAEVPPAGDSKGVAVMSIVVPYSQLSCAFASPKKQVHWIKPPSEGESKWIQMFYCNDTKEKICEFLAMEGFELISIFELPSGSKFVIRARNEIDDRQTLIVPASFHESEDLVFSGGVVDPNKRNISLHVHKQVDEIYCYSFTGLKMPQGVAARIWPDANYLSRTQIVDRRTKPGSI